MGLTRVHRYADLSELAVAAARRLLTRIADLQEKQDVVNVCLTHGSTGEAVYEVLAKTFSSAIDSSRIQFWWNSESFIPATDPERNATRTLTLLGQVMDVASAQIHPMPYNPGNADPDDAAFAYATELGDTTFDICLLGMGVDGHVAAIFPEQLDRVLASSRTVLGISDAPKPPAERITLTYNAINRSTEVWLFVAGTKKAKATQKVLAGDQTLPATHVKGRARTVWFVDEEAAAKLPYYEGNF